MKLLSRLVLVVLVLFSTYVSANGVRETWLDQPVDNREMVYLIGDDPEADLSWDDPSIFVFGTKNANVFGIAEEHKQLLKTHGYDASYRFLSNFYLREICVDQRLYKSSEHYYQAIKFDLDSELYLAIVNAETPAEALRIAHEHADEANLGDDQEMATRMKRGLWAKFVDEQGGPSEVGLLLLATKDQLIIEGNRRKDNRSDRRWGAEFDFTHMPCSLTLRGKNILGKLLMELRAYLMTTLQSLDHSTKDLLPGTVIFLGSSEQEIQTMVLCLENGLCSQISAQNHGVEPKICHLKDLDLDRFAYRSMYKTPSATRMEQSSEYPAVPADCPAFLNDRFEGYFINKECLPFVLSPKNTQMTLADFKVWAEAHQEELRSFIAMQGAILLRGLPLKKEEDFATVVKAVVGRKLIDYKGEGSRKRIAEGVYTSTEAPPQFKIPLHNELSCTLNPVDYICFYCDLAPEVGTGQTILARTQDVTTAMMKRAHVWDLFNGKTIKYISRHPPEGSFFNRVNPTHKTWPQAFETTDRDEVERICKRKGYDFKWMGDWIEVTRHVPAIRGPDQYFSYPYWFNQAHLYHANPRIRGGWVNHMLANLLYISSSTRQYDIEFEDGSEITQEVVYDIYDVLDEQTIRFSWEKGDVLLIDNRRVLHGRTPYEGQRRILTTMIQ